MTPDDNRSTSDQKLVYWTQILAIVTALLALTALVGVGVSLYQGLLVSHQIAEEQHALALERRPVLSPSGGLSFIPVGTPDPTD